MLSLLGPTRLHTGHVASEATKTFSHTGFPPSCKHLHLCLLVFMIKLEVSLLETEPRSLHHPYVISYAGLNLPLPLSSAPLSCKKVLAQ